MQAQRPLRFGVMCAGTSLRVFQADAINRLIQSGVADPVVFIVDGRTAPVETESVPGRLKRRLTKPNFLWRLYSGLSRVAAMQFAPRSDELAKVPQVVCRPVLSGRFSEYFSDEEIVQIRAYDLDFILRFGFGAIRGDILQSARYGVWSFHHDDESRYRGGPPAFWEIYEGDPVTGAALQRLTERLDAGKILRRGYLRTVSDSYARNLNDILMESARWPASVANEIAQGGDVDESPSSATTARNYTIPSNLEMLLYFSVLVRNIVRHRFDRLRREAWNIGIVPISPEAVISGAILRKIQWYPRPKGASLTDPMAFSANGAVHLLCERMQDTRSICSTTYDGKRWGAIKPAIDAGPHSSHPYMFEYDGRRYCVPDTLDANEVRLYACIEFPRKWELAATVLQGVSAVDTTLFEFDGRWWLFCMDAQTGGARLHAYHAQTPFGPWLPHMRNPVKVDVRSARPAGAPFYVNGTLYRPAQDCSRTNVGRIAINRIVDLSPSRFAEVTVAYVEPDRRSRFGTALRTLSFAGEYCVVDGKR